MSVTQFHSKIPQPQFTPVPDDLDITLYSDQFHTLLSNLAKEYDRIVGELGQEIYMLRQCGIPPRMQPTAGNFWKQAAPVAPSRMVTPESTFSKQTTPRQRNTSRNICDCSSGNAHVRHDASTGNGSTMSRLTTPVTPGRTPPIIQSFDTLSSSGALPRNITAGSGSQDSKESTRPPRETWKNMGDGIGGDDIGAPSRVSRIRETTIHERSHTVFTIDGSSARVRDLTSFWEEDLSKAKRHSVIDISEIDPQSFDDQRAIPRLSCSDNVCMLSPLGKPRLFWDMLWCVSLAYDMWWSMFLLVFCSQPDDQLSAFKAFSEFTMCFWFCDIVLNFFTAVVVDGRHIVFDRRVVAYHYARTWLCFDIVATFPFDKVLDAHTGSGAFSSVRVAKASKAVKLVKALRLIRAIRFMHMRNRSKYLNASYWLSSRGSAAATLFVLIPLFVLFAHFHGCLWAYSNLDWQPTSDSRLAFQKYRESFWWAYTAITFGTEVRSAHPPQAVVEALLCSERVMLFGLFGAYVAFKTLAYFEQHAHLLIAQSDVISYLKNHDIAPKTQIEVIRTLHETAPAMKSQQNFHAVADKLPLELRRTICTELWSSTLLTLELLEVVVVWHGDIVTEIAQFVKEEVHASNSVLCREGDPAISAYHIIQGKVEATSAHHQNEIPLFVSGHWMGERSLAFQGLTRSATATCLIYTIVLMVPADDFHKLLEKLEIQDIFRNFVDNEMGLLCGRCGRISDHSPDKCPSLSIVRAT